MNEFERLDGIADAIKRGAPGADEAIGVLSTGERIYVALAASRCDLLAEGDSVPYALHRLGDEWLQALIERHRYDYD